MKTYKQLAEELGVSKDKVKYRARGIPEVEKSKIDGVTYVSEKCETLIKSAILGHQLTTVGKEVSTSAILPMLAKILENQERIIALLEEGKAPDISPTEKPRGFWGKLLG